MRTLKLTCHRTARVWTGTLPETGYAALDTLKSVLPVNGGARKRESRVGAIEILVPQGGRFLYGLLGCHFEPNELDHLTVTVNISSSDGRIFGDSLAAKVDEVRVGLPAEYADAVLAGVASASDGANPFGAGNLSFDCAAHGAVGSCEVIYGYLAATLVRILSAVTPDLTDQELIGMFPKELR